MSDIQETVNQLIEQAHLAILRREIFHARTLLKKAVALDPLNAEALRLLQSLPARQSVQPRMSGESEHDFAARIAYQAGAEERARLDGDPWRMQNPSLYPMPTSRWGWLQNLMLAVFALGGIVFVTYLPVGRGNPEPISQNLHLNHWEGILLGILFGFAFYFGFRARFLRRGWW